MGKVRQNGVVGQNVKSQFLLNECGLLEFNLAVFSLSECSPLALLLLTSQQACKFKVDLIVFFSADLISIGKILLTI